MKNFTSIIKNLVLVLILSLTVNSVTAQEQIAVLQTPFVVLLDATDGTIDNPSFIDLSTFNPGTPKAILQVNDEIWIADQIEDRIDRFDLQGVFLSTIDTGLDNIRGLEMVNGEVWIANAGTNNGAPGNAIVRFSDDGTNLGFFLTSGSDSVFDILDAGNNEVYLSYIFGESKIERRDYAGNVLGNIVEEGVVSFIQQMELNPANNSLYAAVFSIVGTNSSGLYEFDIATGNILSYYPEGNLRGVALLGDGNVLVSNAAGVRILDPGTGTSTVVNGDSSQYFGRLNLTPIASVADAESTNFVLYPNPANQELFVESGFVIDQIEMFSMTGKRMLSMEVNADKTNIDISSLPNGVYILTVVSNGNKQHQKCIVSH